MSNLLPTRLPAALSSSTSVLCIGCGGAIMNRDATDMATAMMRLGHTDVTLLVGQDASHEAIRSAFTEMFESAADDAGIVRSASRQQQQPTTITITTTTTTTTRNHRNIVIYFSGHGKKDDQDKLWLLPHEEAQCGRSRSMRERAPRPRRGRSNNTADNNNDATIRGVSASELRKMCLGSSSNVLLILDCCYAGSVATNNLGRLSRKWRGEGTPGRIILTSSGDSQVTYYQNGARNSPLTSAILRTLNKANQNKKVINQIQARNLAREVKSYFASNPHWGGDCWSRGAWVRLFAFCYYRKK